MNLNEPDATNVAAAFAASQSAESQSSDEPQPDDEANEQKLDQLDEKLKVILEQARQGEDGAIAKLRQVEEALLDGVL